VNADVAAGIEEYIRDEFMAPQGRAGETWTRETSLFRSGILDSFGLLELVTFLEKRYGIKIHDEDMVPENFDSVVSLTRFVAERTRAQET